jgi:hypothetical protein
MRSAMASGASMLLLASLVLAGCGGGAQTPSMGVPSAAGTTIPALSVFPQDRQACQDDGDIHVMPCRVRFDTNHTSPKEVRVTSDGRDEHDRRIVRERDDCVSRNVATVTKETNHRYTVAPGTAAGSCTAHFEAGMRHDDRGGRGPGGPGDGDLHIENRI